MKNTVIVYRKKYENFMQNFYICIFAVIEWNSRYLSSENILYFYYAE